MTLLVAAVTNERRKAEGDRWKLASIEVELHQAPVEDIVAHLPGVVWEAWGKPDAGNQRIDFVSSHVEKMLGYSEDEWLSTPTFGLSIVHPDDGVRLLKRRRSLRPEGGARAVFAGCTKTGMRFGSKRSRSLFAMRLVQSECVA